LSTTQPLDFKLLLAAYLLTVGIQRVVNRRLSLEQLVIVLEDESEAFGDRFQATRFWREILRIGISPSDNWSKSLKRWIHELVLFDYGVEAALRPMMAKLHICYIERDRVFSFCDLHHLLTWHIEKLGLRINEPFDQPGDDEFFRESF
jgi:hypothetical protein